MNKVKTVNITDEYHDQRVDNYLIRELKGVPKSRIYRIIRKGEVRVNGARVKPALKLQEGDVLRIPPIRMSASSTNLKNVDDNILKSIVYEDKFVLIIDKPPGLAVHGGSGLNHGLIESLRAVKPENPYMELIHRLDRGTSGCLMIAKKRAYLKSIQEGLRSRHKIKKSYLAVVEGKWPKRKRVVNAPLRKNLLKSGERMTIVDEDGKESVTEVELLSQCHEYSLLRVSPITGRTHQIRVHCQYQGFPVVGDEKYGESGRIKELGRKGYGRMMLHAESIALPDHGFESPSNFRVPLKGEMRRFVESYLDFPLKGDESV